MLQSFHLMHRPRIFLGYRGRLVVRTVAHRYWRQDQRKGQHASGKASPELCTARRTRQTAIEAREDDAATMAMVLV